MELLSYLTGAKFLHVPYRGGAPALNDTIAGHVPLSVLSVFQVLPLIQDGKLKPLAVTAAKRRDVLPNVQTVAEAGVANYEAALLFGLIAPAGTAARGAREDQRRDRHASSRRRRCRRSSPRRACCRSPARRRSSPPSSRRSGQVGQGHQGGEHQGVSERRR